MSKCPHTDCVHNSGCGFLDIFKKVPPKDKPCSYYKSHAKWVKQEKKRKAEPADKKAPRKKKKFKAKKEVEA